MNNLVKGLVLITSLLMAVGFILYRTGDLDGLFSARALNAAVPVGDSLVADSVIDANHLPSVLDSAQMSWLDSVERVHPLSDGRLYSIGDRLHLLDSLASRYRFWMYSSKSMIMAKSYEEKAEAIGAIIYVLRSDSIKEARYRNVFLDTADEEFIRMMSSKSMSPLFVVETPDTIEPIKEDEPPILIHSSKSLSPAIEFVMPDTLPLIDSLELDSLQRAKEAVEKKKASQRKK